MQTSGMAGWKTGIQIARETILGPREGRGTG